MSSMKSFKSKHSHRRDDSQGKVNASVSQSNADFNLKNVFMNVENNIQFKLQKRGQKITQIPARLQITNQSGTRIMTHLTSSKDNYFSIIPNKYILQNGDSCEFIIKLVQIPYVEFEDYESQTFQINWGRLSSQQINNRIKPTLTESKSLKCVIKNKGIIGQILAKAAYQSKKKFNQQLNEVNDNDFLGQQGNNQFLQISNISNKLRGSQVAKSSINYTNPRIKDQMLGERQSLLRKNVIIAVAAVSFVIGFLTA